MLSTSSAAVEVPEVIVQAADTPPQAYIEQSPYASNGRRFIAFLLDQVFLLSCFCTLAAIAMLILFLESDYGEVDPSESTYYVALGIMAVFLPLWVLYHIVFWGTTGRTLGKIVMDLRVVRRDGRRLGFGRAALRLLAYFLSALTLHLPAALLFFNYERRAMHDVIAGSVVAHEWALQATDEDGV